MINSATTAVGCVHLTLRLARNKGNSSVCAFRRDGIARLRKWKRSLWLTLLWTLFELNGVAELIRFYVRTWRPVACVWMQLIIKLGTRLLSKSVNEIILLWTRKKWKMYNRCIKTSEKEAFVWTSVGSKIKRPYYFPGILGGLNKLLQIYAHSWKQGKPDVGNDIKQVNGNVSHCKVLTVQVAISSP